MAILCRTKFTSLPFERAFRSTGLSYTMVGAQGFFQRREVQDLNGYLIAAVNPKDDLAFERIINVPRRGIGPAALKKIVAFKERGSSLQDATRKAIAAGALAKKASADLDALMTFLDSLASEKPEPALRRVLDEMHYVDHLESFADGPEDLQSRLENIEQVIYDASKKSSIEDYLEDASLIRDDQDLSEGRGGVRISTIHAAKGLEYPVVFVVALEEGLLPHSRSLRPDQLNPEEFDEDGIEEERRLLYVAMTRASDHLHLTWSETRKGGLSFPSRFIDEIPGELLKQVY
jgi:DNA helicase-2/ATP-dependent DNA helicase PcrA